MNRLAHLRSKQNLDSSSKEMLEGESSTFQMESEKSLSKMEFHQILERYKARAMVNTKPI
jgi:hypothetical protein